MINIKKKSVAMLEASADRKAFRKPARVVAIAAAGAAIALLVFACSSPLTSTADKISAAHLNFNASMAASSSNNAISFNPSPSASFSLSWDKSGDSSVAGYKVHIGTSSGSYSQTVDVGNATSYQVTGLDPSKIYYAAVSDYNAGGTDSGKSNEVTNVSAANVLPVSGIAESTDDGNVDTNTLDGNLGTRWSAEGANQWVGYDLGDVHNIRFVNLAVYNGDNRQQSFDVYVSSDNSNWYRVYSGQTSGTTTKSESFAIPETPARYVIILGHGNTSNDWNSLTEVRVLGW